MKEPFLKKMTALILFLCETVGDITVDTLTFFGRKIKSTALFSAAVFSKISAFISKLFKATFVKWAKHATKKTALFFAGLSQLIATCAKHAENKGAVSGIMKFFGEIGAFLKKNKKTVVRVVNYVAPAAAVVVILIAVNMFSNVTLAFEVKYSGETIGYISDENVFNQASEIVNSKIEGNVSEIATSPEYNVTLVKADKLSNAGELSNAIIELSSDVVADGYGLYINNQFVTAAKDKATLDAALDSVKSDAKTAYKTNDVEFGATVQINEGLYLTKQISNTDSVKEKLTADRLPIVTTVTKTLDKELSYNTVEIKDNTKSEGYKKISVSGQKGVERTVVKQSYINGVQTDSEVLSTAVIKKPVDQQVIVGTLVVSWVSVNQNAQLSWPVARVSRSYVSSYFGAGRGHTGIDIAAPSGTQIYAAQAGTVISVENGGSYGKHFVIDHGNGMKTLYAHCSSVDVSVGQQVKMGQGIAKVGSTGKSTGPHLHIEVIINGVQVNPAPYLGL